MGKVAGRWQVGVGLVVALTLAVLAPGWAASPVVAADMPAPTLVSPPPAQPPAR